MNKELLPAQGVLAANRIASYIRETPLDYSPYFSELTGANGTECTGGARGLDENDLKRSYKSLVDPRLNYEQALEMAMLIAHRAAKTNAGSG